MPGPAMHLPKREALYIYKQRKDQRGNQIKKGSGMDPFFVYDFVNPIRIWC
jgi:hypothetical protein